MFEEFINRILEDERIVVPSHQEKVEPNVIEEKTAIEIKIPQKYQEDIESLKGIYQEYFSRAVGYVATTLLCRLICNLPKLSIRNQRSVKLISIRLLPI